MKDPDAFLTIGELASELGRPPHILRYWEKRFPTLRPLQRAGGRRYYRAGDVMLARRIDRLLASEGYTLDGAARVVADGIGEAAQEAEAAADTQRLRQVRARLRAALAETA